MMMRIAPPRTHAVLGTSMETPPPGMQTAIFGMGCFWGAEKVFWQTPGVHATAVGYAAGSKPNPTYQEVCTGFTGHAEVVRVIFDPNLTTYEAMLKVFWENHDPTQGFRQGNDIGTQYRSGIYTTDDYQARTVVISKQLYQDRLTEAGLGSITTEIVPAPVFYFAEEYHQQYLAKNPGGYCGHGGTGVSCPIGLTMPG